MSYKKAYKCVSQWIKLSVIPTMNVLIRVHSAYVFEEGDLRAVHKVICDVSKSLQKTPALPPRHVA